ncbi:MAG: hypothetical protein MJZ22_06000, partial [Candidatus Saccharibacteria bacterium]|nr:hypothetical protein [Candidatus Saccharibacteria bacterium]
AHGYYRLWLPAIFYMATQWHGLSNMWLDTRMAALHKRKWREGMAEFQAEGIEKAAPAPFKRCHKRVGLL